MKKIFKIFLIFNMLLLVMSPTVTYAAKSDDAMMVYPGGEAFGIKMFSSGIIVTKIESFESGDNNVCPAEDAGIELDDIIISADNKVISSNNDFKKIITDCRGNEITLRIKRDEEIIVLNLKPELNKEGVYKAGMWIKDSAAGLGTISFYSCEDSFLCGLGHGILESDTGVLMPLAYGDIESAYVTSVTKSQNGKVGTLNGYFTGNPIGKAYDNTDTGIYGTSTLSFEDKEPMEIAEPEEVKKGKAYILTTIDGTQPQQYEITIQKIKRNDSTINMVIEVTDEDLISKTGGIVQGMSGSPIIQDGKIVGAVTHVLVEDVKKGYGIFAKTMYEQMMCSS